MGNPQRTGSFMPKFSSVSSKQGGDGCNRCVVLCLGLLNVVLLIVAVVLGVNSVTQLFSELDFLQSNHSDVIEAEEEAKKALERAIKNHEEIKVKIEQLKNISDGYQKQVEALRTVKTNLQSNISTLEGSCGSCLPGWILFNSSCYFFSSTESSTVKKNWHYSRADCVRRGSDLVVIDDQEEQTFVSNTIKRLKTNPHQWTNGFWVGLTDIATVGTWVWINNVTEVEQRYWMDGEPNVEEENCVIVIYSPTNPWKTRFDGSCQNHQLDWICELPSR
ncbi:CD209 antigen-like isoform X2 [Archocentrus centrarchus]|uniref:CD209 antigen-like isoform X2 n=1 Tax=Archocentrus centrarchus TaxID=63155 RepID=UPI0011EA0878|nr:CD209 antigen-like isoform X2 [Archocentrus centrarchus]